MPSRRWWLRAAACIGMLLALCATNLPIYAQSSSVTVGVGDNILVVQGKTSPNAFVTISRGTVIGSTTADASGNFSHTFPAQEPGIQEVSASATTQDGATTDTITASVHVAEHATTTLTLFLPPTLAIANASLTYNEPLRVSGETCPACAITAIIDGTNYTITAADANGRWHAELSTAGLASGNHSIFVRAADSLGSQSYPSNSRTFTVAASPVLPLPFVPPPATSPSTAPATPTITFPTPGTTWTSPTITVQGTAEPGVQIELFDGANSIGSVWSDRNGAWSLTISLESRDYLLRARACRGQICSPFSSPLAFTVQLLGAGKPLIIRLPRTAFFGVQYNPLNFTAEVLQGEPPYTITVDWGDGTTSSSRFSQQYVTPHHTYDKPGKFSGWVEASNKHGRSNRVYFTADVTPAPLSLWIVAAIAVGMVCLLLIYFAIRAWQARRRRKKQSRRSRKE